MTKSYKVHSFLSVVCFFSKSSFHILSEICAKTGLTVVSQCKFLKFSTSMLEQLGE